MIDCDAYIEYLRENGIDYFAGVPDSLIKDFCACVSSTADTACHVIAANEGGAVALASGHYLATGRPGLVYMQNSGLGNAVNPLVSLADPAVYSIPMLLLIGWRGEPGRKDEPQHVHQGAITVPLLDALNIRHEIHPASLDEARCAIDRATEYMNSREAPYAFVVPAETFAPYPAQSTARDQYEMSRETAVAVIADVMQPDDIAVATTGRTSRELFEHRAATGTGHEKDFLNVGAMGHTSQIALAIATAKPDRRVYCFDGDGALLMHAGSLAIIGARKPANLIHVVFNNAVHDSVGAQPTVARDIDIPGVARAFGYRQTMSVATRSELEDAIENVTDTSCPTLIEVMVTPGARSDLGRPTVPATNRKRTFMEHLARS
jgi:phosphonopyruvate decarboxylase